MMKRLCLRLAFLAIASLALAQPAPAETALEFAAAERYIGSRRFTPYARAWCADALNAWLRQAGYRGTGDGRAAARIP